MKNLPKWFLFMVLVTATIAVGSGVTYLTGADFSALMSGVSLGLIVWHIMDRDDHND